MFYMIYLDINFLPEFCWAPLKNTIDFALSKIGVGAFKIQFQKFFFKLNNFFYIKWKLNFL